jgi:hypothetical protein
MLAVERLPTQPPGAGRYRHNGEDPRASVQRWGMAGWRNKKRAVGFPTARFATGDSFAGCYLLAKGLNVPNDRLSSEALLIRWKSVPSRPVISRFQYPVKENC